MTTPLRVAGTLAVASASLVVTAPGASALSCATPRYWFPDAEHVFVGRIADAEGGRLLFEVDEVWQGGDLPRRQWVPVTLEEWFTFASNGEIPDGYSSSRTYVVATDADLVVSPCSLAPDDGSDYGVHDGLPRPPVWDAAAGGNGQGTAAPAGGVRSDGPVESLPDAGSSPVPLVAGGAGVAGLAAALAVLWRRRLR